MTFKTLGTIAIAVSVALSASASAAPSKSTGKMIGVNVVLKQDVTSKVLTDIARYGTVRDVVYEIDALTLQAREVDLPKIRSLPYVAAANPDAARNGSPVDTVAASDFMDGLSTWDQDAINVTVAPFSAERAVTQDGTGVYVAILDTGLLDSWRQYFPQQRIATDLAKSFGGGGGENGNISEQPNKWEHDQNSHGSHVTSTILGYSLDGVPINGAAPMATVIPVKVLNQNGSGWSSVIARGITYIADLKSSGVLGNSPVVINMSLGGPSLDAMEKAAIDYAIGEGVIIVASAGNSGEGGMGYPGAYGPVISAAASGWTGQWTPDGNGGWWYNRDVAEPTSATDFYIADFSSRELNDQDLDVAAPGSWVVGPYQVNSGQLSYYYLSGTSMAAPHVTGIAALMMQKNPALEQSDVETILEATAIPMSDGCRDVNTPSGPEQVCWDTDATGHGLATADAALAGTPTP
jgi:subtilisin family serine protease